MPKVLHNFLEQEVIDSILQKYNDSKNKPCFEVNEMGRWDHSLHKGNFGPVYILPYDEMNEYFANKFKGIIPEGFEITTSFMHIWQPGSSINWHTDTTNDGKQRIGVTIYLNEKWESTWGGLFLYETQLGIRSWIIPTKNVCVWFQSPMWHSVTTVLGHAPEPRLSMQLFFTKK